MILEKLGGSKYFYEIFTAIQKNRVNFLLQFYWVLSISFFENEGKDQSSRFDYKLNKGDIVLI